MSYDQLNERQKRFVDEYLVDLNATQAYYRAGYEGKEAVANVNASRLLSNAKVYAAVEERINDRKERTEINQDFVLENLQEVALRCMQRQPITRLNKETGEYEETGVYKFDANGANKALELLGKHLKMFTDKVEQENSGQVNVSFNIPRPTYKKPAAAIKEDEAE